LNQMTFKLKARMSDKLKLVVTVHKYLNSEQHVAARQAEVVGHVLSSRVSFMTEQRHIWSACFVLLMGCAVTALALSAPAHQKSDETSDYYRGKCVECHGEKAELKFDEKLSQPEMVKVILKGKLVEDPPDMPAFEEKGITEEQAKALAIYMLKLRKP